MASVTKNADKFYKYRRRIFELIRKIYDTGCYDRTLVDLIIADKKAEQTTVYHFDPREDVQSQLEEIRMRTEENAASPRADALRFEIFISKGEIIRNQERLFYFFKIQKQQLYSTRKTKRHSRLNFHKNSRNGSFIKILVTD